MRTEDDFLQGLRDEPEDDDLRLIFADWLEDQDDGRSALLRLQVERRRLQPDDPALSDVLRRQHNLVRRALLGWLAPLAHYSVYLLHGNGLLGVCLTGAQLRELNPAEQEGSPWGWVDGLRLYGIDDAPLPETLS